MNWFRALILSSFLPLSIPAAFAQQTPTLLHGAVVGPEKVMADGWIEVQDGKIVLVSDQKPNVPGALVVETGGTIYPGFVDLHNHPTYSVFPRWEPSSLFVDRYIWRGLPGYGQRVGTPGRLLQEDKGRAVACCRNRIGVPCRMLVISLRSNGAVIFVIDSVCPVVNHPADGAGFARARLVRSCSSSTQQCRSKGNACHLRQG
jgi:hypothetical protein